MYVAYFVGIKKATGFGADSPKTRRLATLPRRIHIVPDISAKSAIVLKTSVFAAPLVFLISGIRIPGITESLLPKSGVA